MPQVNEVIRLVCINHGSFRVPAHSPWCPVCGINKSSETVSAPVESKSKKTLKETDTTDAHN